MPKVSVIIPVYGVEKYIGRCAISLFEQTLDDIEFIFVNDASKDNSMKVLDNVIENYPNRKPQVRIFSHTVNKGLPQTRQTGLKYAHGQYVLHCDPDDWMQNDMVEKMYCCAIKNHSDIVVCDYFISDGNINQKKKGLINNETDLFLRDMLYSRVSWAVWNKLVLAELYNKEITVPRASVGEDMSLMTQLTVRSNSISYMPEALYYYFYNPTSMMMQKSSDCFIKRYNEFCQNIELIEDFYRNKQNKYDLSREITAVKLHSSTIIIPLLSISPNVISLKYRKDCIKALFDMSACVRYKAIFLAYKLGIYGAIKKLIA